MFGQDIFKLALFLVLIFTWFVFATAAIGETSNYKHKALIESKEDITKPLVALENKIQKLYGDTDVYIGGTYNKTKDAGYPILAVKYSKYTLEFAREGWFDAPKNNYWKLKVKKPFGIDRINAEIQQKKKQYTVKGFVKLF